MSGEPRFRRPPCDLTAKELLQAAANRRDPLGIETEPVHAPDVTGVLDFDAAVHDHRQAARFGDPGPILIDHAELAPQRAGSSLHCFLCDRRKRIGRPKDVDDVYWHRHVD